MHIDHFRAFHRLENSHLTSFCSSDQCELSFVYCLQFSSSNIAEINYPWGQLRCQCQCFKNVITLFSTNIRNAFYPKLAHIFHINRVIIFV